jgi:hypothetical protein
MIWWLLIGYCLPVCLLFGFAVWHNRKNDLDLTAIGVYLVLSLCWPLTLAIVAWRPRI